MDSRRNFMYALVAVLAVSPVVARAESGDLAQSTSSALVVYNDHYIPDSVRAKYNLQDQAAPQSLQAPEEVSKPQLVIEAPPRAGQDKVVAQGPVVESWRARRGESLQNVLRRWGERQSVDVKWNSSNNLVVGKDFTFMGTFDGAVEGLLKENAGGTLQSHMMENSLVK